MCSVIFIIIALIMKLKTRQTSTYPLPHKFITKLLREIIQLLHPILYVRSLGSHVGMRFYVFGIQVLFVIGCGLFVSNEFYLFTRIQIDGNRFKFETSLLCLILSWIFILSLFFLRNQVERLKRSSQVLITKIIIFYAGCLVTFFRLLLIFYRLFLKSFNIVMFYSCLIMILFIINIPPAYFMILALKWILYCLNFLVQHLRSLHCRGNDLS